MRSKEVLTLRILELCKETGLNLTQISTRCSIPQSTLRSMIDGRNHSLSVSAIQKLCDGLDIDLPYFFASDLFRSLEQEIY